MYFGKRIMYDCSISLSTYDLNKLTDVHFQYILGNSSPWLLSCQFDRIVSIEGSFGKFEKCNLSFSTL